MHGKSLGLIGAALMAAVADVRPQAMPSTRIPNADMPDRVDVDPYSPHHDKRYARMGVFFNGVERRGDVQEYCVSEGWIKVRVPGRRGKFQRNPDGTYVTQTLRGAVRPFWKSPAAEHRPEPYRPPVHDDVTAQEAAEAKRARKAEKLARIAGK